MQRRVKIKVFCYNCTIYRLKTYTLQVRFNNYFCVKRKCALFAYQAYVCDISCSILMKPVSVKKFSYTCLSVFSNFRLSIYNPTAVISFFYIIVVVALRIEILPSSTASIGRKLLLVNNDRSNVFWIWKLSFYLVVPRGFANV